MRYPDLSRLPTPFPGWDRFGEDVRKEALWQRWSSHQWDVRESVGHPLLAVAGRRSKEEGGGVQMWGGEALSRGDAVALWQSVQPEQGCWVSCSQDARTFQEAITGGQPVGNVREFLMDIADAAYPGPASVTVAPLSEDDYDDVLDLVKREGVRGRSDRLGAEDKYGWVRERLFAPSEHGAVGGWRGEKLLGLLHLGVWSQSLGLWQVLHSAIDPEAGPGLTLFRDLLNGWQARAGIRVDAVKMGVPEEAQEVLERFKIARLKESWTRALVWYPGG